MSAEWFGYLALGLGLFAIAHKNMLWLRIVHGLSAACYICYGLMISAYPIAIGGSLFLLVHAYHLRKIYIHKKTASRPL